MCDGREEAGEQQNEDVQGGVIRVWYDLCQRHCPRPQCVLYAFSEQYRDIIALPGTDVFARAASLPLVPSW